MSDLLYLSRADVERLLDIDALSVEGTVPGSLYVAALNGRFAHVVGSDAVAAGFAPLTPSGKEWMFERLLDATFGWRDVGRVAAGASPAAMAT